MGTALLCLATTFPIALPYFLAIPLAAISLLVLMATFVVLYLILAAFPGPARFPAFLVLLAWIGITNDYTDKYTYPGIIRDDGNTYYGTAAVAVGTGSSAPPSSTKAGGRRDGVIDPILALDNWKRRWEARHRAEASGRKPKLVIVATSGGAYRSAFWTAIVLDRLMEEENPSGKPLTGISDAIRVFAGASGGMVGAAYFAANRSADGLGTDERLEIGGKTFGPTVSALWRDILWVQNPAEAGGAQTSAFPAGMPRAECRPQPVDHPVPGDSLSAVMEQMVRRDFFHLFWKTEFACERGMILENQWPTLSATFADWREGELAAWRPSLIFSPMIVETGQPLLISNLDLGGKKLGAKDGGLNDGALVGFFRTFSETEDSFRIKTAVRMSATFPLVSPALVLPTRPRYRVVDAGYYDNYGTAFAVHYLSRPEVRTWIVGNVSMVIILGLQAFPVGSADAEKDAEVKAAAAAANDTDESWLSWIRRSFPFLLSPFEGVGSARQSAMIVRGRKEMQLYIESLAFEYFKEKCGFSILRNSRKTWVLASDEERPMMSFLSISSSLRTSPMSGLSGTSRRRNWWAISMM